MRAIAVAAVAGGLVLAGCRSSSPRAAGHPSTSAGSTVAPSTTAPAVTTTGPALPPLATPRPFATPTFIETRAKNNTVAVVRASDGKVLQWLKATPDRPIKNFTSVERSSDGTVLVDRTGTDWRAPARNLRFPGGWAEVSPDGRRVATLVWDAHRRAIIRQYDIATGHAQSDLVVVAASDNYGTVSGFGWTPDSRELVVSALPGGAPAGGLYVVARDTHTLPTHATITAPPISGHATAFFGAAVLANGHVLTFLSLTPVQHDAWPAELDDIDLKTGARRVVVGDFAHSGSEPICGAQSESANAAVVGPTGCEVILSVSNSIEAHGDQAIATDGDDTTWLYDGRTAHVVGTGIWAAHW